jgi:hypothetical protein
MGPHRTLSDARTFSDPIPKLESYESYVSYVPNPPMCQCTQNNLGMREFVIHR